MSRGKKKYNRIRLYTAHYEVCGRIPYKEVKRLVIDTVKPEWAGMGGNALYVKRFVPSSKLILQSKHRIITNEEFGAGYLAELAERGLRTPEETVEYIEQLCEMTGHVECVLLGRARPIRSREWNYLYVLARWLSTVCEQEIKPYPVGELPPYALEFIERRNKKYAEERAKRQINT